MMGSAERFRLTPAFCFVLAFVYYSFAITNGNFKLFAPVEIGLTFNSMLSHLLHGQFDVDPNAIQAEAFVRDGKTYAYFGIFPALLRLPLLGLGLLTTDITILSCVLAASLAAYFKVKIVAAIRPQFPVGTVRDSLFVGIIMAIVFGGPQVQFLKPSIYQEAASWAGAIAAAYVCTAFYGLVIRGTFSVSRLLVLSALSGIALLTRASTGGGLYVSTTLLLLVLAWQMSQASSRASRVIEFVKVLVAPRRIGVYAVLLAFMLVSGTVNYGRWGNPLTFADLSLHVQVQADPVRLVRLLAYGELNVKRIGLALLYYFLPVPGAHDFETREIPHARRTD
jgi:hypothetical protein